MSMPVSVLDSGSESSTLYAMEYGSEEQTEAEIKERLAAMEFKLSDAEFRSVICNFFFSGAAVAAAAAAVAAATDEAAAFLFFFSFTGAAAGIDDSVPGMGTRLVGIFVP